MTAYAKERAHQRIRSLSHAGLDVARFLDEASAALSLAVPNENHLNGPYWYVLDPDSRLITSDYGGEGCELDTSEVMRWEYLDDDDLNKYREVLDHPRRAQTLHEVTGGKPERSRIYREYMAANGLAQEMLVALGRSSDVWGTVRLNRLTGQPEFDASELAFMAAVAPDLAVGIRRGLVVGEATDPDRPDCPGLIIFDAAGEVVSLSLGARRWIELLPSQQDRGSLPASIASAAAAALACARGERPTMQSTVVVRSIDGCWISVHGTVIGVERDAKAAVIIEPAHPDRISPLLMAIHGLTPRERQVTRLVLQGRSTRELAGRLRISPLTVQEHLKGIFAKVGVRNRHELVAALFFDNFSPRVHDNGHRVRTKRPIRGGPLREER